MPETPLIDQTRVGETFAGAQFAPSVAALPGGSYVIVWLDDARSAIFGQIYEAGGQRIGGEFQISATGAPTPLFASVGALDGGGFVVAWQQGVFDSADIHARRFDSTGTPVGSEFTVNSSLPNEQLDVRVVGLDNGGFLIAWDNIVFDSFQDVSGRLFNALGEPIGPDFTLNTNLLDAQGLVSVAPLAGGGFVATWQSVVPANSNHTVLVGQLFGPSGAKLGGEFQINADTPNNPLGNDVARLSDDGFVVSWVDPAPANGGARILARHYDAAGVAIGGEIEIASKPSGTFGTSSVTALAGGAYLVSWTDQDNSDNAVSARAMGAGDVPLGDAFDVSIPSVFSSVLTADGSATLANGTVVFTWDGPSTNTSEDVYFRLFQIGAAANPPVEGGPGPDMLDGGAGNDTLNGNGGDDTLNGAGGDDLLDGGDGNDALAAGTGIDSLDGGDGDDSLYFGPNLTAADSADGGDGADTLVVQGNYAAVALGPTPGIEVLLVATGSDTRFGDTAGNSYDYGLIAGDGNVPAGGILTVIATGLLPGEDLSFDGSAETDGGFRIFAGRGADSLTGGAGSDGFFFGADGNLTAADRVIGGGGVDSLALRGPYAGAGAVVFQNAGFGGIEVLVLLSGLTNEFGGPIVAGGFDYDLTLADGNIAAGLRLDVNAVTLAATESVRLDARAEADGSVRILSGAGDDALFGSANADILYGGLGADAIDGGGGADTYLYRNVAESTVAARDTLAFTPGDRIDLGFIDAIAATPGVNDAFAFIGAGAFTAAGQLRAVQSGDQWIVEAEVNGDGIADFTLAVTGAVTIVAGDFVL